MLHGTWQVTGGGGPRGALPAVIAVIGAAVLGAVLATVLWILAAAGMILLAVIVVLVIAIRRSLAAGSGALSGQAHALSEAARQQVTATPKPAVVHYHVHLPPGASATEAIRALPINGDAVTTEYTEE